MLAGPDEVTITFLQQSRKIQQTLPQSDQIGSAWEWYHWTGLKRTSTATCFLIFYFWSWIFEKSSKLWAASYKNESNLLLVGMTTCLESFLPIGCRTFICWKNPPNIILTSRNPKNNCWISRIFGVRFGGKDRGLCPSNPWSQQVGGLDAFLFEAAQNFEVFSKIQDQN